MIKHLNLTIYQLDNYYQYPFEHVVMKFSPKSQIDIKVGINIFFSYSSEIFTELFDGMFSEDKEECIQAFDFKGEKNIIDLSLMKDKNRYLFIYNYINFEV